MLCQILFSNMGESSSYRFGLVGGGGGGGGRGLVLFVLFICFIYVDRHCCFVFSI